MSNEWEEEKVKRDGEYPPPIDWIVVAVIAFAAVAIFLLVF